MVNEKRLIEELADLLVDEGVFTRGQAESEGLGSGEPQGQAKNGNKDVEQGSSEEESSGEDSSDEDSSEED